MWRAWLVILPIAQIAHVADAEPRLAIHSLGEPTTTIAPVEPTDELDDTVAAIIGSAIAEKPPDPLPTGRGEFDTHVARDGTMHVADGPNVRFGPRRGPRIPTDLDGVTVVSFDIGDAMMRRHGIDPYASAKLRALDSTRAARVEAGLAYRAHQLGRDSTIALVAQNVARVFATIREPAAQAHALAELWHDCALTGSEDLVAAGDLARDLIAGAARSHGLSIHMP